jgi:hypothetical protein
MSPQTIDYDKPNTAHAKAASAFGTITGGVVWVSIFTLAVRSRGPTNSPGDFTGGELLSAGLMLVAFVGTFVGAGSSIHDLFAQRKPRWMPVLGATLNLLPWLLVLVSVLARLGRP